MEVYDELEKALKEIERLNTDKEQLNSLVNSCQEEIRRLYKIIDKAIDIYEGAICSEDWSTVDLDMYLVLTGQEDKLNG